METRQLKTFIAVYKTGSFTKASELLATSQPAISEHIKNLEKNLGCKLFDRLGRSIRPTRKADVLYPKALVIIDDLNRLENELAAEDLCVSGELVIGASSIPGAYLLPRLATVFKTKHPEISFEIRIADSGEIIDSVLNHDLLIGIVGTRTPSKNLKFAPFVDDELVLAVSAGRKIDSEIPIADLFKLPFLLREKGSGTRKSVEEAGLRNKIEMGRLNTVAVLGSNAAIKEAIKEDLGVSILSRISICDELESGRIKEVAVKGLAMKRTFYAVTLQERTLPNHYSVFLRSLLQIGN
ncbi:MAG: LysR family transcriptional regulator [Proteobacteria bacterium]|nr:LysR family transcriptional regulator [Pseudomonadota bacterium]MBU1738982.1 LysR family transcriptional regulator [Pseudomonadota bacterium]